MNEFHDPQLENLLGRASGAYPDDNVAFEAVRGRVRQVRRRRAMMASTAACMLLAGVVALAVRGGGDGRFEPSDQGDGAPSSVAVTDSTDVTETSVAGMDHTTDGMSADTTVVSTTMAGVDMPGGTGSSSGAAGQHNTSSGHPATTTAPQVQPTTPAADVLTYSSKGGSIAIQTVGGRMVLVGDTPMPGFTSHITELSGDRIRVEFGNGTSSSEIQLELSDGKVTPTIQNKGF